MKKYLKKFVELPLKTHGYILFGLVILFAFFYEYNHLIFYLPQSNASWRQADCASFTLNFYQHGMHFFKPHVHNVLSNDGSAVGECPILYYFIAILYHIFGPHEVIFKIVTVFIFFFALSGLFRITFRLTGDLFASYLLPLIFLSTPLLMIYAISYLPDVTALSFCLLGWDQMLKYRADQKIKSFYFSMLFFVLGAWLKANSAISFIAIGAMFFIELNEWGSWGQQTVMFKQKVKNIVGFIVALGLIIGWYAWAVYYNDAHQVSFLGTQSWPGWPIWELDPENYSSTVISFYFNAFNMFNIVSVVLFFFLLPFVLLNRTYLDGFLRGIVLLLLIGVPMFFAYFFLGMRDQVYYYVNLAILPIFVFIASIVIMKKKYEKIYYSTVFKILLVGFLFYNVSEAKSSLKKFYHGGKFHERLNKNFYDAGFRPFIDKIGIGKTDRVISIPDITPNVSLYVINRPGWSNFNYSEFSPVIIDECITKGAKYLVISDSSMYAIAGMDNYTKDCVGKFGNIYVYKLPQVVKINLLAGNGKYVTADLGSSSQICANRDSPGQWEAFIPLDLGDNKIALKAVNGKYISAEFNHFGQLAATRDEAKNWETFIKVVLPDGKIALKADNGKYVSINSTSDGQLKATSDSIGKSERFVVIKKM